MKQVFSLLFATYFAFALIGCSKKIEPLVPRLPGGSNSGNPSSSLYVQSYQSVVTDTAPPNYTTTLTFNYAYNIDNQPISCVQTGTTNGSQFLNVNYAYTYAQNQITQSGSGLFDGMQGNSSLVLYGPAITHADSTTVTSTVGAATIVFVGFFFFDANGYCIENDAYQQIANQRILQTKTYFTISGGNVVEADTYLADGTLQSTETLTYGTHANTTTLNPSIPPVMGTESVDLATSSTVTQNGAVVSVLNYSYTFDGQNRVSSMTAQTPSGQVYLQIEDIVYLN